MLVAPSRLELQAVVSSEAGTGTCILFESSFRAISLALAFDNLKVTYLHSYSKMGLSSHCNMGNLSPLGFTHIPLPSQSGHWHREEASSSIQPGCQSENRVCDCDNLGVARGPFGALISYFVKEAVG